jgi:hypothetical protein
MGVFWSFSHEDFELAEKLQEALERRNIRTRSILDDPQKDLQSSTIEQASSSADAIIFLLGSGASVTPQLQAEWQAVLRNDWDSKKPMIPVLMHGQAPGQLPKFLINTRPIVTTNFDQLVNELEHRVQNPDETGAPVTSERNKAERRDRLEDLKTFAEALKSEADRDSGKINL